VSEATDSLTIIVSEETGGISVAYRGTLQRSVTEKALRDRLIEAQNKTAAVRRKSHWFRRAK
jgi:diadenylate cyclase